MPGIYAETDNMPWLTAYQEREWNTYEIPLADSNDLPVEPCTMYSLCDGESIKAAMQWNLAEKGRPGLPPFYSDVEQLLGAGLDEKYGVCPVGQHDLNTLTEEWNGHPVGSLVLVVYKGIHDQPVRHVTVLAEVPSSV